MEERVFMVPAKDKQRKFQRGMQSSMRFLISSLGLAVLLAWSGGGPGLAQGFTTTTVQGTVYAANGNPGSGTLLLSWPAFTTSAGQSVTAGRTAVSIGSDGFVSVNLAPNQGATPAGLYYTAVFNLSDGTTSTEYWVVPAAAQATIGQVRAQLMPAAQAVQAVSKSYVDQSIQELSQTLVAATGGSLTGPLYLIGDPTAPTQAADKHYVDAAFAQALPVTGGAASGPLTSVQLGGVYQADQFAGADFGAKLQACINGLSTVYGGTCDARNFTGSLTMGSNLTFSTANVTVELPCSTITTSSQIVATAGTRNVTLHGCASRGTSAGSGNQGGTVFVYAGSGALVQVGDPTYVADTLGFRMDNVAINTTGSTAATARAVAVYRTQEMGLQGLYLLGNSNQTGILLDGTGNYTGGTLQDVEISGFGTAVNAIGHQIANSATTDWVNASTFVRLHIDCPTSNGNPMAGTFGINLQQGDGNTFTGGDVEGCATALHLGASAQNNTLVGLRNENSTNQVVADAGSAYNSWITGGTMYTGQLTDNGTRNSFMDTFHRSFNTLNGDWYGSQQDATLTNHFRLGIGTGNERGLLNRYQTDSGYRWTMGLSDAMAGAQFYQILDELNNVYRLSIGQYNNGQSSTNNQTAMNSAGTGAIVLNGSTNSGTGGVVFGAGGTTGATVATVNNAGNAQFNGTLMVGGTSQSTGTMTVRNNADAEVDYYLWPGLTGSQKGSYTYKDYNGNSQWYMVKDASNNWALNSAIGGLDSFKAYQSSNSGDTYVNASNNSGVVRVNYEPGSGSAFNVYGGNSNTLYASFSGQSAIKFPGLASSSGTNCLQADNSGYVSNSGIACGASITGSVGTGILGQIAYYTANGSSLSGLSAVPIGAGGTGASTAAAALTALGGASLMAQTAQSFASPLNAPSVFASVNSQINVMASPYNAKGDCQTDDNAAITAALRAADAYAVGNQLPAVVLFPKPPGGCYLTSTLTWYGEPLEGQGPALGRVVPGVGGVILQGKPGQDILHVPDPSISPTAFTFYGNFQVNNLVLRLDDTQAGSFPHRWPGRWADDIGMTAGSTQLTSSHAMLSCGDVGQAIMVTGAGASGANLVSTIASVQPCWPSANNSWQVVNLATAASTTVSNAHTYVSVGNLPVTTNVGACAIAFDDMDALNTDWPVTTQKVGMGYSEMHDIQITSVSGATYGKNNSCGWFNQGNWIPYGLDVRNFSINRLAFGVVEGTSELNSYNGSGGDYQTWDHGLFNYDNYPWISYGGGENKIVDIELTSGFGPQVLNFGNSSFDFSNSWYIRAPEFEMGLTAANGGIGWRIEGANHFIEDTLLSETPQPVYLDFSNSVCHNCSYGNGTGGVLYVNGYANDILLDNGIVSNGSIIDNGRANRIYTTGQNASPYDSIPPDQWYFTEPMKGMGFAGFQNNDFLMSGDATTPWTNNNDLFFWPKNVIYNKAFYGSYGSVVAPDAASLSGWSFLMAPNTGLALFSQFVTIANPNGTAYIGTNVPATNTIVYLSAKCPSGTTSFQIRAGQNTSAFQQTFSCSTSYQTYSMAVNLTGLSGQIFQVANPGTGSFYLAWWSVRPFQADYNGSQPLLSASTLSTTSGDAYCASSASGQVQDCGPSSGVSPTAPTPMVGDNSNKLATTAYVQQSLSSAGQITNVPQWLQFLGDGSDGALNCTSGSCNANGEHWYTTVNVAAGATVTNTTSASVGPMVIRATGACTIAGTISMSVNSGAVAGFAGAGGSANWSATGGGGGGGTAAGAQSGLNTFANVGGGAGAASGGSGGNGGLFAANYQKLLLSGSGVPQGSNIGSSIALFGGSGGGNGGSSGGTGGKGGGGVILVCGSINFTGTIDASGQAGTAASANNTGAGGGGGGGFVIMRSPNMIANTGTVNVIGGAGGSCGSYTGCGAGGSGGTGWSKVFLN